MTPFASISTPQAYLVAERQLQIAWDSVKHQHPTPEAHAYVQAHWTRYAWVLAGLGTVTPGLRVLEIGASIIASALRQQGAEVSVAYHELEPEWDARFRSEGIEGVALELCQVTLPWPEHTFDWVLCDQVLEHLPIAPDFLLAQLFRLVKPGGKVILAVPNFAQYEKRKALLLGCNPQDTLDARYVYYAHHREPVMPELVAAITQTGGRVSSALWVNFESPRSAWKTFKKWVFAVTRGRISPILKDLYPPLRDYLWVVAQGDELRRDNHLEIAPPMAATREFQRKD